MLNHRPQKHLYGCLYHVLFALTGDPDWLEHVDDLSEPRWLARLHAAGAIVLTYYSDLMTDTRTNPDFWRTLQSRMAGEQMNLLVTCDGQSGMRHVVALTLPKSAEDKVVISDSALESLKALTFDEFLVSRYAQASEVQQILPADLDAHAYDSGAEYMSKTDATLYAPM